MTKHKLLLTITLSLLISASLTAQTTTYDPRSAAELYTMARNILSPIELSNLGLIDSPADPTSTQFQLRRACLYLEAATEFDPTNPLVWRDLVDLYLSAAINDPDRAFTAVSNNSIINPQDNLPVNSLLDYYLSSYNDLDSRQAYLLEYLNVPEKINFIQYYPHIYSQILTQLGKYAHQKGLDYPPPAPADTFQNPNDIPAHTYFSNAYAVSPYNDQAYAGLLTLPPQDVTDPNETARYELNQTLRWRIRLLNNPHDLQAAFELINTLEQLQKHDLALEYIAHAQFLLSSVPRVMASPDAPYWRKALQSKQLYTAYTRQDYIAGISLAQDLLVNDPDNLMLNALHGRILVHLNENSDAQELFQSITSAAEQALNISETLDLQLLNDLTGYYCFVNPDPNQALKYAQLAYQSQDDPFTESLMAYAFMLNQEPVPAKSLLTGNDPDNVIALLTRAKIALNDNNQEIARNYLNQTDLPLLNLSNTAPCLAAILAEQIELLRSTLPQPTEIEAPETEVDLITETFGNIFNGNDLQMAQLPERAVHFTVKLNSDSFNYGDPIMAQIQLINVSLINNIPTELILGPGNFIDPHVIITAQINTSSDLTTSTTGPYANSDNKPIKLLYRYLLQNPVLMPGESNSTTEALNISTLRQILQSHPQQEFTITFRAYLDPVSDENNNLVGSIPSIQPAPVTVIRKAFIPTMIRLNAIKSNAKNGTAQERINATRLLAALVHEAELARRGQLSYRITTINVQELKDIVFQNLSHSDPLVRGWSVYALHQINLTPDSPAVNHLSKVMSSRDQTDWLARFMALEVLDPIADLNDYLEWAATTEDNLLLHRQILLYQRLPWQD